MSKSQEVKDVGPSTAGFYWVGLERTIWRFVERRATSRLVWLVPVVSRSSEIVLMLQILVDGDLSGGGGDL